MATEVGKAYVQILPETSSFGSSLKSAVGGDVGSAGSSAGESFGASMVSKLKGVVAAAGIGTIVKETLSAGGDLQQSFGGLDTLYGEASDAAKQYAREAAQAGISMNDYAEQAVSFGAGLKQAFDGDTVKAAEAANTAILDMADNAAKMGTPLESIQNAYQGFAKQNYTMLDNLKLGYGGTKQEMERLLADAEKLSGVHYDMENLGDVYEAIHVVQEDLGLTGVAAEEASETFTGSMQAMKASATNLMADLATGNTAAIYDDIQTLFKSVETFVFDNLGPMLANIISRVPQLLANLISEVGILLSDAAKKTNMGMEFVSTLITTLIGAISQSLPDLLLGILDLSMSLIDSVIHFDWAGMLNNVVHEIVTGLADGFSYWGDGDTSLLDMLIEWVTTTLPQMAIEGIQIITSLIEG